MSAALILTHTDPDGFACAALIAHQLRRSWEVRCSDYSQLARELEAAAAAEAEELFITDLSLRQAYIDDEVLGRLARGRRVHLFDHHRLKPARRELLRRLLATCVVDEGQRCAAWLVLEHLGLADEAQHRALAEAAQGCDYEGTVPPAAQRLAFALDAAVRPESGLPRRRVVELLADGPSTPWQRDHALVGPLRVAAERVEAIRAAAREALAPTEHEIVLPAGGSFRVACALAPTSLYLKEGGRALKARCPGAAVVFALYESTGVVGLPAEGVDEEAVPLLPFLISIGGGGRNNAGGFSYDTPTTAQSYPRRRDALLERFRRFVRSR